MPRHSPPRFAMLALSCCLLAHCGGTTEDAAPAPHRAPETARTAQDLALAEAQCGYLERCDADGLHSFTGSSRAACVDYFACSAANGSLPWLRPGAPPVDPAVCIQSLNSRECPDVDEAPLERFSYIRLFPWGPACGIADLADLLAPPPDAPGPGAPCLSGLSERAECQGDAYCAVSDSSPSFGQYYCGVCTATVLPGEACSDESRCAAGYRCVQAMCTEVLPVGAPCALAQQCRFGTCDGGLCGRSQYAPEPYDQVVDRACVTSDDCGNQAALSCRVGRCTPLADEGEPCGERGDGVACRLGQGCVSGRCAALGCTLDPGEPCSAGCHEGVCIDGVCAELGSRLGDRCESACAAGLVCVDFRCAAPAARGPGTPCDYDFDCDSGFCDRDLSDYCSRGDGCSIPECNRCGVCANPPTAASCE